MSEFGLTCVILAAWAVGAMAGHAIGYSRACNRLIPELNQERETVSRFKLLLRLRGEQP